MPYQVIKSSGAVITNLADNTVDNSTSLTLVGRNYPGYGGIIANNFVHLLENAANATPPALPLIGQLWYDTGNGLMNVWTGTSWFALTTGVASVLGQTGAIALSNLTSGGLAPSLSPNLTGVPIAPTAGLGTNSNQIATTAFVLNQVGAVVGGVSSVLGSAGSISLAQLVTGGLAPLGSPSLSGIPTAPTPNIGSNNNQIATTAYVISQVGALSTGVSSVMGLTGNVTLAQLSLAGLAPIKAAQFQGVCTAPTPATNTNTNQLATCAFVLSNIPSALAPGVPSVLGLTGAIALSDLTSGGLAPSLSPNLTGVPSAPTAGLGTNSNQIATTAFVHNQVSGLSSGGGGSTGVSSVVGRTGDVTLTQLTLAGLALASSIPNFTAVQQGGGIGQGVNKVYLGWDGAGLKLQVDASDLGHFTMMSQFGHSTTSGGVHHNMPDGIIDLSFVQLIPFNGVGYETFVYPYPIAFPNTSFDMQTSYSGNSPPLGVVISAFPNGAANFSITTNSTGFYVSPTGPGVPVQPFFGVLAVNFRVRGN